MSTIFLTKTLLFAVLVVLGTFVLALSAKEHTRDDSISQAKNEGFSDNALEGRDKRATDIKIELNSKINFSQRLKNETGKTLQKKLQNETSKMLQPRPKPVKVFQDCEDVQKQKGKGWSKSGVFTIKPTGWKPIKVYCDMKTNGGGWTVIQRRFDKSENFDRTWAEYKSGFGKPNGEYWLGNENIHRILGQGKYKVIVKATLRSGKSLVGSYEGFELADKNDKYRLKIGKFRGSYRGLHSGNGKQFRAKDTPNNKCQYKGGWWYKPSCIHSFLTVNSPSLSFSTTMMIKKL